MADILDIVSKFTYQVEDTELKRASVLLTEQIAALATMVQRLQNLQATFDKTSNNEIDKRTKIVKLTDTQQKAIEKQKGAITSLIAENKKLQDGLARESAIIVKLQKDIVSLNAELKKAMDTTEVDKLTTKIAELERLINKMTTTPASKGKGGTVFGTIMQGVGIGTGIGLVTQAIAEMRQLVTESVRLSAEAAGVTVAFDRLNQPGLLSNLRAATGGTVSDLELMKNAINFNNFGLPVEKLSTALEFARQRARDTGQSVDYLVQSIVTGIGRQSPLILDNLGINAKRVADRFKETGNFAEAAFGIIQEETAKAGDAVENFGDTLARQQAKIDNLKVSFGNFITFLISRTADGAEAFIDWFGSMLGVDLDKVLAEGKAQIEAEDRALAESRIDTFERYLRSYETADANGKRAIENQTREHYNELIRQQQSFFNIGLISTGEALQGQINQYQDFFNKLRKLGGGRVSFGTFTQRDLLGLTREELEGLKTEGENSLNPLAAGDTAGIAKINNRISQINAALDRFNIKVKQVKKDVKEKPIKIRDLIEQTPEQWAQEVDKIAASLAKIRQPFSDMNLVSPGVVSNAPNGTQNSDEIISQRNDIERAEIVRKDNEEKEEAARQLRIQRQKDAFKTIVDAAIQSYNIILQAQINAADAEIAIRQSRVNAAIELAKNGNTEILEIEQQRLEESIKEREKYAQRQAAINAALTVSQSVLAIATAAGESGAGALVIVPAVIAAIAAGFAAVTALSKENSAGFADGVVDLEGPGTAKSDSIPARLSRGESVITAEATAKNKAVLMAMNNGAVYAMPNTHTSSHNYNNSTDMSGVISELRELKTVVADNQMKQDIFFNEHGVGVLTERAMRANRRKWS